MFELRTSLDDALDLSNVVKASIACLLLPLRAHHIDCNGIERCLDVGRVVLLDHLDAGADSKRL
jgi:hypothetical protein